MIAQQNSFLTFGINTEIVTFQTLLQRPPEMKIFVRDPDWSLGGLAMLAKNASIFSWTKALTSLQQFILMVSKHLLT